MNRRISVVVRPTLFAALVVLLLTSLSGAAVAGSNSWTTSGPSNGTVYSVAVSPTYASDHTLFAGGTFFGAAGIFKSTSSSPSWNAVITGLPPEAHVHAVSMSPAYTSDHTVFAGTDLGVYKSVSGGSSWTQSNVGLPMAGPVYSVAVSPAYASDHTVFVGGSFFGAAGIFKSTSVDTSWTAVISGLPPEAYPRSLAISPAYATDHTVFAGTDTGVYISKSGGASWSEADSGFPTGGGLDAYAVKAVAISPAYASDHTVFVGGSFYGAAGIFKSATSSPSWVAVNTGLPPEAYVHSIAVSPAYATDHTVFAGTDLGVYKSTNGGTSWSPYNVGLTSPLIYSVALSPAFATDHTLFAGGAGVWEYTFAEETVPVEGSDRIATAIAASKLAFPAGSADWAVVTTAYNWPDALGGSALAGALDCPILLTPTGVLPGEVLSEITRLGADHVIILGGTSAVSEAVETALLAKYPGAVERIAGSNRYETARLIAARAVEEIEDDGTYDGNCFVATGEDFPDALGASPIAAAKGWPIYLVNPATGLDPATASAMRGIDVQHADILGGTAAVSDSIKTAVATQVGCTTTRLAGANRYSTAVAVASYGVRSAGLHWDQLALATGTNFPDALAGGVLQGRSDSVMLLTPSTSLDTSVRATLAANKSTINEVRYLGGTSAISAEVRTAVANVLK